jgi:succinate dehydrogenase / fumarate reductase iron-sulfur subunit
MPELVTLRIKRQDRPNEAPYWQTFQIRHVPQMNVISCLQAIAANPVTVEGKPTTPVVWDCNCLEEVCGACTMVINGRVRQSCTALVNHLLEDNPREIVLEPMTKFPVIRDLFVDRSSMFEGLKRFKCWVPVDGYYDAGPGPTLSQREQEETYPLSRCMTCGCCLEACPQVNDHSPFVGAALINQVILFNSHPTGRMIAHERLEEMLKPGGITECGNAQNCVKVCPKEIPLTDSIARLGRETTIHAIRRWLRW